jgi:ubiquinone biosynthesis protein
MQVPNKASDVQRVSHVVHVLFKHGLGYFVEEMELKFHLPFFKKWMKHKFRQPVNPAVRLTKVLEELGGTYIKLGQLLSIRPDLIHLEYCEECQKLQDRVTPFPFEQAKRIIESELKKPLKQIFKSFNEAPIAAASIGQVYEARLKNNGRVAVKVQRPNIRQDMESDIRILEYFARKMEKHEAFRRYRPTLIVEEFKRYSQNELDYVMEAHNADQFYKNFEKSKTIKIPKVFWSCTTSKVLTLEFIDGTKINELLKDGKHADMRWIVKEGLAAEFKQIFDDGFFHADLHPGNILLLKNKKIAFLDFGIVGSITPSLQRQAVALFLAIAGKDSGSVSDILLHIGSASLQTDRERFGIAVAAIVNEWYGTNISEERVTHMLHRLFNLCAEYQVKLPVAMVLLGKALVTIEGTCRLIDPKFDLLQSAKPYFGKIMERQSQLQMEQLARYYGKFKKALLNLPDNATKILDIIREPRVKVDIEDTDIRTLGMEIDRSSNRIAYGIMIAALVVAGALMIQTGPKLLDVSVLSLLCFVIAIVMGGVLVYSVLNEGK